ncbi:hypothetical protein GCM10018962_77330 [Dactylosporangium matsuzakiense]|uniref:hypothetical protein n=1 Tax=Dactylosporangium matsuzakiense TaxID=53360 RepID=UPI0031E852AC
MTAVVPLEVEDGEVLDDPPGPSTAAVLGAVAYRSMNHAQTIIDALRLLADLHGPRDPDRYDYRCKTCRDSRGRPAPWPCVTYVRMGEVLGLDDAAGDAEMLRDAGRIINGQKPRTEAMRDAVRRAG